MRPIPEFPGYFITWGGHIFSTKTKNKPYKIKASEDRDGYLKVCFRFNGKSHNEFVHRLVLLAYKGTPSSDMVARHLDGNRKNNRLWNLTWGTPKENSEDRIRHGKSPLGKANTKMQGEKHPRAKLSMEEAQKILELKDTGQSLEFVAKRYGVSQTTIHGIWSRISWKCLGKLNQDLPKEWKQDHSKKLDKHRVISILKLKDQGFSGKDIANQFGVSDTTIHKIWNRQTWKQISEEEVENA